MSTYLTDEDKAGLFEKAMLCDHPNCELCREAIPFIEELIRRHRAEAWDEGYRSGHSNAMRQMSDEPNAPTTPNPYEETT